MCQKRRQTVQKTVLKTNKRSTTADKDYGNADELDNVRNIGNPELINEMNAFIR